MTSDDGILGDSYRAVRALRSRDDGPWPGVLARTAEGEACVLVDADTLGPEWSGWDAAPAGHVLAPRDIARRAGGHDVVLPLCVERLEDFVRRRAARMPLSAGEAVTLGVSLLRGCAQVADGREVTGEWWLDDAGRPVLATQASATPAHEATAAAFELVSVAPHLKRTWDTAVRAVTAERVSPAELAAAEDALFALATAEPLSTVSLSPRSAAEATRSPAAAAARESGPQLESEPRSVWRTLVSGVDDDLADTVSRATTAVWRRLRAPRPPAASRRAPWLVGGAVAVAVLAGGALWPTAGEVATARPGASATASPGPGAAAGAGAAGAPAPGTTPGAVPDGGAAAADAGAEDATSDGTVDVVALVSQLLDDRLACGTDLECLTAVAVEPGALSGAAIDLPAAERTVTLLDDFGDLAVVRVDAAGGAAPSQLVVIVRQDAKWLLRDVHDIAQQP